ncbi:tryptophan-rich sensory protein [Pontimicrobium aquaticum]|uniref:Tryptophan-rich sensory protein n=1 Tax=Pontimicrobium aquaticum TaxID=2565367 RepID=A0A4V5LQX7_9FLAO|nr:tryptophan-rich sensory protein [Pontimicrobium aquaticum]TJY37089.1 tryptophan-rich sensory protein [Pontimicrobium aquaticum]
MNTKGKDILIKFTKQWQLLLGLEVFLYALGISTCMYFLSQNILLSLILFVLVGIIASVIIKPWKPDIKSSSSFLDNQIDLLEYSTGLLLQPWDRHSSLAKLQQLKVSKKVKEAVKEIQPPHHLKRTSIIAVSLIGLGFVLNQLNRVDYFKKSPIPNTTVNPIIFKANDSISNLGEAPKIVEQWVTIGYPKYTNIPTQRVSKMNIKALEGSQLNWELKFDNQIDNVMMQSMENNYPMRLNNASYIWDTTLTNSGFYNFKFEDVQGNSYTSDLYAIEAFKDAAPTIKLQGLNQFTSFNYDNNKIVEFKTTINDDFGVADAYIIATVSKGSGESVKFREEKLNFDNSLKKGTKNTTLSKKIDLDNMNMEPGDELYFYVETQDFKTPKPNIARSETYFAVIRDTTSYEFSVEGTLGVDRMPDYFRSQRQLIIDTEKLIKNRKILSKKDFNFTSNELGFDQKSLRLKYGAFMGEESEIAIVNQENAEVAQHELEQDPNDPLAGYKHDHDSENEHNLVEDKTTKKDEDNPLEAYMHNHDDPEKATLFEESLRTKLKKALNEMWDAELYLRLYEPEKSLPFQYKALKYIQEIKNSARVYVHRIGFDPPPIKEDKRLTGKLEAVKSYRKNETIAQEEAFPFMRQAILTLEVFKTSDALFTDETTAIFENAGNELSTLAVEFPGKYLNTLQQLRWIIDGSQRNAQTYIEVQRGLLMAIPKPNDNPSKTAASVNEINQLLLKELDIHDK